ncbi:hypothetical protein NC651_004410 [Populus alba x Populus x berolinensis]|nr:hypothetical protein NC651_004410 [Populus alba x Populus x berolinensis]
MVCFQSPQHLKEGLQSCLNVDHPLCISCIRNWRYGFPTSGMTLIYSIHQESNHICCNCLSNICTYIIVMIYALSEYLLCTHNNYVFFNIIFLLIYIYPLLIHWF